VRLNVFPVLAAVAALSVELPAASSAPLTAYDRGRPSACPAASVLSAALRLKIRHVSSYVGSISSTTIPGMGPAPDDAHYKKTTQRERTCTYSGSPNGPITISFIAPITADAFSRSRTSLRRSGVAVVTIARLGDTAWAARASGLVFVLQGSLDIVISAPRSSLADLKALADRIV